MVAAPEVASATSKSDSRNASQSFAQKKSNDNRNRASENKKKVVQKKVEKKKVEKKVEKKKVEKKKVEKKDHKKKVVPPAPKKPEKKTPPASTNLNQLQFIPLTQKNVAAPTTTTTTPPSTTPPVVETVTPPAEQLAKTGISSAQLAGIAMVLVAIGMLLLAFTGVLNRTRSIARSLVPARFSRK